MARPNSRDGRRLRFYTLEGVDGTGKSTVLPALAAAAGDRPFLTKEPGTPDFRPMEIEPHLNGARFFLAATLRVAVEAPGGGVTFVSYDTSRDRAVVSALYAMDGGEPDAAWLTDPMAPAPAWAGPVRDAALRLTAGLDHDPTLRARFATYGARGCLRHALMHAADSREHTPTSAGLVFYANHYDHQGQVRKVLASGRSVVSDRYAESQIAYGRANGCHPAVEAAYGAVRRPVPNRTVLLTAAPEVLAERLAARASSGGAEAAKQAGKAWGKLDLLVRAQDHYLALADADRSGRWITVDTSDQTPEETIAEVTARL